MTFPSDLVFDGVQRVPYAESDAPRPLNMYGRSKRQSEERVLAIHPGALVVRTSSQVILSALVNRPSPEAARPTSRASSQ